MKKGFTLIELLAVIVILAIIALIATPIILGIINDAREESNERSVELYASAVRNGIAAYQLRTGNEVLPGTYNETNKLPFEVEYDGKVDCASVIISEDGKVSLEGCTVNGGTKEYSYGLQQEEIGKLCTLASDSEVTGTSVGAKYNCKVDPNKPEYTFYVLNTDQDDVNLIMDSNIRTGGEAIKESKPTDTGIVYWISNKDFLDQGGEVTDSMLNDGFMCQNYGICVDATYGPITAMNYLEIATSNWTNLNKRTVSTYTTIDEFNQTLVGTHNLKKTYSAYARMPYYSEVVATGCAYYDGSGCPSWMTNYLSYESGVYAYWLLSYTNVDVDGGYLVSYADGLAAYGGGIGEKYGVRPVITISTNDIQ